MMTKFLGEWLTRDQSVMMSAVEELGSMMYKSMQSKKKEKSLPCQKCANFCLLQ